MKKLVDWENLFVEANIVFGLIKFNEILVKAHLHTT